MPVRLLVAGCATDSGQKVHNLLAGTADLPPEVEILAFVDSDARPHPGWLRLLVQRLDAPAHAAATGYRWFIPTRPSLAAYLQYAINAAAAVMYRPDSRGLVWGGSWAIRRDKFDSSGLHAAWQGTLSDDLVASRVLRKARMRVEFEPACMLPSPLTLDIPQMLEFLRRQYVIGRTYALRTWCLGFASIVLTAVAFWSGLVALCYASTTAQTGSGSRQVSAQPGMRSMSYAATCAARPRESISRTDTRHLPRPAGSTPGACQLRRLLTPQ